MSKLVPAPLPEEMFLLAYTVSTGPYIDMAVYVCRLDGTYVPDPGRTLHRKWHEQLNQMILDAGSEE